MPSRDKNTESESSSPQKIKFNKLRIIKDHTDRHTLISNNKPVGDLARATAKQLLLSVDASNDILSNAAHVTPPTQFSLFYAARYKTGDDISLHII